MEVHLQIQHLQDQRPVHLVQAVIVQTIMLIRVITQQAVQEDQLIQQRVQVRITEVQKVQPQSLQHQG